MYRIKEFLGRYEIQKSQERVAGFFWNKRTVTEWQCLDIYGRCCVFVPLSHGFVINTFSIKMKSFKTHKEALKMIASLEKGVVYHEVK
jgi:hypothetical protein